MNSSIWYKLGGVSAIIEDIGRLTWRVCRSDDASLSDVAFTLIGAGAALVIAEGIREATEEMTESVTSASKGASVGGNPPPVVSALKKMQRYYPETRPFCPPPPKRSPRPTFQGHRFALGSEDAR